MVPNSLPLLVLKFLLWNWTVILRQARHRLINRPGKCLPCFDSVLKHWKKAILALSEYIVYKSHSELRSRGLQTLQAFLVPFKSFHNFSESSHCYQHKYLWQSQLEFGMHLHYAGKYSYTLSSYIYFTCNTAYLWSIIKPWKVEKIINARKIIYKCLLCLYVSVHILFMMMLITHSLWKHTTFQNCFVAFTLLPWFAIDFFLFVSMNLHFKIDSYEGSHRQPSFSYILNCFYATNSCLAKFQKILQQ